MFNQFQISNFKLLDKALRFLSCLFLFLLPWQTIWIFRENFLGGIKMEWMTEGIYFTEILLWLITVLFMAWYWRLFRSKFSIFNFQFSKDRIFTFSVFLFIIYCSLSIFWSRDPSLALQHSLRIMEAFILFFILFLGSLNFIQAIKWLVAGSILPCLLSIWQFLSQSTFASTLLGLASHPAWQLGTSVVANDTIGRWLRAYGSFNHPNVLGGYLVIVLVIMQISDFRFQNKNFKILLFTIYCLLFTSLFFTFSRSAWLAAVISLLVYQFISLRNRKFIIYHLSFIIIGVILVIAFFPLLQTRLTASSVSEVRSTTERVGGYGDAWKLIKQDPIFGVGAGNYTYALWHSDKWRPAWEIQPVHNAFVLFVVETGMVGVLLLWFVAVGFSRLMMQIVRLNSHESCYLGHGSCLLLLVPYSLLLTFDHYLYSSYIGLMLSAIFFALIMRNLREQSTINPLSSFDESKSPCHNRQAQEPVVGAGT